MLDSPGLWAMVMYVMPCSITMEYSLRVIESEMAELHSSRIANLGFEYSSRAIAKRCFSPNESSSSQLISSVRHPSRSSRYSRSTALSSGRSFSSDRSPAPDAG